MVLNNHLQKVSFVLVFHLYRYLLPDQFRVFYVLLQLQVHHLPLHGILVRTVLQCLDIFKFVLDVIWKLTNLI